MNKSVICAAEEEKKRKYNSACEERHATFTPLVTSVDGVLGTQFQSFMNVLSERLAERWTRPIMSVLGLLRARLGMAIVRAASMCVRGSRRRWKSGESLLGYEDGVEWSDS
uniref:Uncharacterized protein n=1 Tax=Cacopsylla melanoneura TaxID=428564 RepID=A0A8D8X7Z1_9HEMI